MNDHTALIREIIQEVLSDRLYHYTYVGTILDILEKDHFLPSVAFERPSEEEVGRDYKYFISFARNLRGTFHKEGRGAGYFVIDGRKLSQNYKGSAIDYWERAKFDPKATKETEAEDRLFTNKPYVKDAAKYIEAVHISAPYETKFSSGRVQEEKYSEGLVEQMKKIAELGKSKGIPVYYHTDLGSYRMANDKKALDFAQWAKGAADAGIIEPAVARSYTPGPPDLMRLETAVNAIEELLIKGTSYKDFLDTLSSEELSYVRRRLFYSFSGNDIASRIRDELNIYKTKPEARPFIARLGRALTKLKMNLAEIGIKLGDLVEKEIRGLNEKTTLQEITKLPKEIFGALEDAIAKSDFWKKDNEYEDLDDDGIGMPTTPSTQTLANAVNKAFSENGLGEIVALVHSSGDYSDNPWRSATIDVAEDGTPVVMLLMNLFDPADLEDFNPEKLTKELAAALRHEVVHLVQLSKQAKNKNVDLETAFQQMMDDPKQVADPEKYADRKEYMKSYLEKHIEVDAHAHQAAENLLDQYGEDEALDVVTKDIDLDDPALPDEVKKYKNFDVDKKRMNKFRSKIYSYIKTFAEDNL